MPQAITCRRGQVEDLRDLHFAEDLGVTPESIEYNVVGLGHEFWIAIELNTVVAVTVLDGGEHIYDYVSAGRKVTEGSGNRV